MKTQRRWLKWALELSACEKVDLPWQRGARRSSFVAGRTHRLLRTSA